MLSTTTSFNGYKNAYYLRANMYIYLDRRYEVLWSLHHIAVLLLYTVHTRINSSIIVSMILADAEQILVHIYEYHRESISYTGRRQKSQGTAQ